MSFGVVVYAFVEFEVILLLYGYLFKSTGSLSYIFVYFASSIHFFIALFVSCFPRIVQSGTMLSIVYVVMFVRLASIS